ncbi:MAG: bL12 family ribosomal protein [Oculatellaceae cyanobacterium bins.114]|nr:bL12 family ribosomal protein [Oculatellaceae cyanobacterium bins.114]
MDIWLVVSLMCGLLAALSVINSRAQSSRCRGDQIAFRPDMPWQLERIEHKLDRILDHLGIQIDATEFDVILADVPPTHKISVLKTVRELTGLGLKEAKDLVEAAPVLLQARSPLDKAKTLKRHLEEAGAIVTITPRL